jgi:hypothetical protein
MQKIALNHVQLVALAASFPLQWPAAIETLFSTFGVLGDAGDFIFNPDCDDPERHPGSDLGGVSTGAAEYHQNYGGGGLFFQKQLMVLLMPFIIVACAALFWFFIFLCFWGKQRKRENVSKTVRKVQRKRLSTKLTVQMVSIAAETTHQVHADKDEEERWHAALRLQLWWDRLHHRYAAKISALARIQVEKERQAEEEAETVALQHVSRALEEVQIHVHLDSPEDELVDALLWPALMNRATFLDTHVSENVIERALALNPYQKLTWEHPHSHAWYEQGTLVRWIPKEQCVNLLKGHRGAWRVSFPKNPKNQMQEQKKEEKETAAASPLITHYPASLPLPGKNNDCTIVYMSNGEVVSARKKKRSDQKSLNKNELLQLKSNKKLTQRKRRTIIRKSKNQERKRRKYNRSIGYVDKFIATVVTVLYLLYPTLTRATFKLVACQTVGRNRYLQMELDLLCWDEIHLAWVIGLFLPALLAYVLGLPIMALVLLRKFRNHLHDKIPRFHFGTLYLGFRDHFYYWEVITAARKTSIIMVAVFLTSSGIEVQALTGSFINLGALLLHMNFRPYVRVTLEHDTLHAAEMWALTVSFITLWMGLFFFQESVRDDSSLMIFLTIVLLLMNMIYILVAFRWFLIIKLVDLEAHDELLLQEGKNACSQSPSLFELIFIYIFLTSTSNYTHAIPTNSNCETLFFLPTTWHGMALGYPVFLLVCFCNFCFLVVI